MPDVLQDVIDQVTDATLTITGTKDLTGEGKKQVLFSLTTKEEEGAANDTTLLKTFTDEGYTSLVITAYKNGTASTEPLEETPLYTRTIQGAQLNRAAINLDITHEVTVLEPGVDANGAATTTSRSQFQGGTGYVFDVRFMKTGGVTLLRKTHTFQDAPDVTDYNFVAIVDPNGIGLTVTTDADAPVLNEVFVEIIKLSDTPGVTEADRDGSGNIIVYSLQKYEAATGGAFAAGAGAQVIRATSADDLPNAGTDPLTSNAYTLASGSSYNMNVIFVTDGGTSDKHRVTPDSSTNTSLLLSSAPSAFKQTFIDQQKVNADVNDNAAKNTLDASILQVLEITAISGSEIIDKVSTQIDFGGTTKIFASDGDYATTGDKALKFETDFVTSLTQNEGAANALTRKFLAIRYTRVEDSNDASSATITGTVLSAGSAGSANYPTLASGDNGFQDRAVAQVCTETVKMFNNKPMGISSNTESTFGTGDGVDKTIKVIYVQLTELDFGMLIDNVSTTISNSSTTLNSGVVDKLVHRTDVTGTLTESVPNDTSAFTTIKMDLPTDTITTTQLASGTLRVTQNELDADGNQSFDLQSTIDLLDAFVDADNIVDFVQLTLDDNSGTGNNRFKSFTLDSSTTPTALQLLGGTHALTLTNGAVFGATANSTTADSYGVLPQSNNAIPPTSADPQYKPYSTKQSIAFDSASLVENLHVVVHLKGYNYGAQLFSGIMSLRYELGSLINNGTGNIVDYADPNGDGNGSDAVSIYGGTMGGGGTDPGKLSRESYDNNTITQSEAGKAALVAGTVSATAFPAMGRTPLKPTVTATQASKAVLPNADGAAFTLTITENFEFDDNFTFTGVAGANGKLALYDLALAANRPSTATIILNGETSESQTFIIDLTGTQTTSDANGDDASPAFTTTTATGTTQGVYSVILENGRTLGVDENGSAAVVNFSTGERLEVFVALGNATYGTSPSPYDSDNTGITVLTHFATTNGNAGDLLPVTTNNFLDKDAANATDNQANGGVGNRQLDVFGINTTRSAGPVVGAPTVSLGPENIGGGTIAGETGKFIFNVVANTGDINQLIAYTQLVVELTVNSTTTTHTFGTFGTALGTVVLDGLTVTDTENYVVTFDSGVAAGGTTATFNGGDTVSAKAKLLTDYDRTGALSTSSTGDRIIRTNASLKNAAAFGNAFLTQNNALFDVDLIDKTTLVLAPFYFNHGVGTVDTWDDIINLNGNSVSDLALEIQVRYERENNAFNTFDADGDGVNTFAQSVTIADGDNFAALANTDVITLNLETNQVNKLKVRLPSGADREGIVRLSVLIRLTTTYANVNAVNDIQPTPFTPYLEKLALDSVEAVSASGDILTWDAKFTPKAYKTNLKSVEMALGIQKNNIASHTFALDNATANNNAIKIANVETTRTITDTSLASYTSSNDPADGAEATVTFKTTAPPATRGSYLVPKFTVNSTASNASYDGTKEFTAYDNNTQPHNVADASFSGGSSRAGQKLAARDDVEIASNPVRSSNKSFFSMIPNGNTAGVILTVDNDGTDGKQLALGHIAGQTDQTNAIGEFINNNPFNAVFAVNVTLTLGTGDVNVGDTTNRVFQVAGLHDLTITPGTTTVANVLTALNAMPIFPSTMLLPGAANGAATDDWSLSNVEFNDGTGVLSDTATELNNIATIQLQFEGTVSDTSKVSYVAVTHVSGGTGAGVSTTENGDNFIVLSLTNETDNAQPLPTFQVPDHGTTGAITDALIALSGITNTTGTNGATSSVSSLGTTADITIA